MDTSDLTILRIIDAGTPHAAAASAKALDVSRQAVAARLRRLVDAGVVQATGRGPGRSYTLQPQVEVKRDYALLNLDEFRVWSEDISPVLEDLPESVRDIWRYGITEMVNNAVDHSRGLFVHLLLRRDALRTVVRVMDDGEGIFHHIQRILGLYDAREAILELAKGKLTTDPERHSGEGVFFTSRSFDRFSIMSRNLFFSHQEDTDDWLIDGDHNLPGTVVKLELSNDSPRILMEVFDHFAAPNEYTFAKTIVPVRLAQHEGEKLVSRSQAKRLTLRFDKFKTVVLDFAGVGEIGQAFADEVFRVFRRAHPDIEMIPVHMAEPVKNMVSRALAG